MIEIRIDELLGNRGRSFYWLANETGISHTTLWRLKKGKALGINFETLEKICEVLKCQPGDVLFHTNRKKISKNATPKKPPGEVTNHSQLVQYPKAIGKAKYSRHGR
jgi:putative transcriptional regulator